MENIYIPKGEPGSINEMARIAIEDPEEVALQLIDDERTIKNVMSTLEQSGSVALALRFAKEVIKWKFLENNEAERSKSR